jgi:hypothetical protein
MAAIVAGWSCGRGRKRVRWERDDRREWGKKGRRRWVVVVGKEDVLVCVELSVSGLGSGAAR